MNTPSADADTPLKEGNFPSTLRGEENKIPPLKRGMKGDLKSPLTPLYERGEFPSPSSPQWGED